MLEETGRDRYQFHDLVRVYAAECAQISEPESQRTAAIRRLLTWYLHTADAFSRIFTPTPCMFPSTRPNQHCAPPDFTTYQQAVDWAQTEFANLVPIARQAAAIGDDVTAWKLTIALMPIFALYRRMADFLPILHSALAATQRLGDPDTEAWILSSLAEAYIETDRPAEAAEFCQRALAICGKTGNSWGQWAAWHDQGLSSPGP